MRKKKLKYKAQLLQWDSVETLGYISVRLSQNQAEGILVTCISNIHQVMSHQLEGDRREGDST